MRGGMESARERAERERGIAPIEKTREDARDTRDNSRPPKDRPPDTRVRR